MAKKPSTINKKGTLLSKVPFDVFICLQSLYLDFVI